MLGSAVVSLPVDPGVCDQAVPPRPNNSEAEPERRRVPFAENAIVLILKGAAEFVGHRRIQTERLPSKRRADYDSLQAGRPRMLWQFRRNH
jgi:hypothetical protein